jgi:hypothetical protein
VVRAIGRSNAGRTTAPPDRRRISVLQCQRLPLAPAGELNCSATEGARPMTPEAAKARFLERLGAAGLSLDALTPAAGAEAMLAPPRDRRLRHGRTPLRCRPRGAVLCFLGGVKPRRR